MGRLPNCIKISIFGPNDGVGESLEDIVPGVADEIAQTPTMIGMEAIEFTSMGSLSENIDKVAETYQSDRNFRGIAVFHMDLLQKERYGYLEEKNDQDQ